MIHQLDGQPIEQFRMTWRISLHAEIFARTDDAGAEVCLPNSIGDDSRGRRVSTIGHPTCERESVPGCTAL